MSEDTQLDGFAALEELEQGDEVEVDFVYDAEGGYLPRAQKLRLG